jgi:hypothetical protein
MCRNTWDQYFLCFDEDHDTFLIFPHESASPWIRVCVHVTREMLNGIHEKKKKEKKSPAISVLVKRRQI